MIGNMYDLLQYTPTFRMKTDLSLLSPHKDILQCNVLSQALLVEITPIGVLWNTLTFNFRCLTELLHMRW